MHNQTFKFFLTIACCLLLILSSATVHAKQTQSKSGTAGQKISPKTAGKNSSTNQQKKNSISRHSANAHGKKTQSKPRTTAQNVSAKPTGKKHGNTQQKKNPSLKLSAKISGKKCKSKHTLSKRKPTRKVTARIVTVHRPGSFQYSSSAFPEAKLKAEMKEYLGIPYRAGGASLKGMDCSGFARTIYANLFGIELPHNSAAQFSFPKLHEIDEDDLQTGDLVFFSRKKRINHVGVYLGDGNFIHATNGNGITISSLDDQHWKSRMVATKRLMSFDKSGMDTLQLQGGFDIPLNTSSRIKSYARDEFRPSYDFSNSSHPYGEANEVYNFDDGHLYAYEVEFSHKLWDDTCNVSMSLMQEKLNINTAWNVYDHEMDVDWPLHNPSMNDSSATTRHGFKLASKITPFEGLSITPSFVYLNYDQPPSSKEMMEVPKRIFGLNTQITPMTGPWSVSMAMHYADQLDMTDSLFKNSDMFNTMDMSFKLGYYFSKNLEFSIMGQHDFKAIPGQTDLTSSPNSPISSDFLFKMDLKY